MSKLTIIYRSPTDLVPYEANAKMHSPEQLRRLAENMEEFDFDVPIVVDENLVIIKGHGRQLAAIQAGISKVPVITRKDLTPAQARAVRIADNKLGESPWDMDTLTDELAFLNEESDLDLDILGFDTEVIDRILADEEVLDIGEEGEEKNEKERGEDYTPNTAPTIAAPKYNEDDMEKGKNALDNQARKPADKILIGCPHCSEEFYLPRSEL